MSACWRPIAQSTTRCEHTLLDTVDPYDAWITGREHAESPDEGDGLRVVFDGTGTIPCVAIYGPDGEIELRGLDEIRAVYGALRTATRFAEAFGPPIPVDQWRQLNG